MKSETEKEINEDYLYVLKVGDNNLFYTDYLKISKDLLEKFGFEDFSNIIALKVFEDLTDEELRELKKKETLLFYERVQNEMPELMGHRSFCHRYALRSAYCEYKGLYHWKDIRFSDGLNSCDISFAPRMRESYGHVTQFASDFFQSYFIERAYEICEKDNEIKAYSHRRVGHKSFEHKLNESLAVEVKTNFSYGNSSYFVTKIILEGIEIIPYSLLVKYRYANTFDIIRNTRAFVVYDTSWKFALDFIKDVSNEYILNGKDSFVSKFIIRECEVLIDVLPKFLKNSSFNLITDNKDSFYLPSPEFEIVQLEGYPLAVFRGEKIAGATLFYDNIKKLSKIIPVERYLSCIKQCAIEIVPTIEMESKKVKSELEIIDNKLGEIEENIKNIVEEKRKLQKEGNEKYQEEYVTFQNKEFDAKEEIKLMKEKKTSYSYFVMSLTQNLEIIRGFIQQMNL